MSFHCIVFIGNNLHRVKVSNNLKKLIDELKNKFDDFDVIVWKQRKVREGL